MVDKDVIMTLIEYRNQYRDTLAGLYQSAEIDDIFKRCIQHFFEWSPVKIGLEPQYSLSIEELGQLEDALTLLRQGTPLQYIFKTTTFMGVALQLSPAVLIPRPETEELVEWVLDNHENPSLKVWDLCSGSGCIAIALKAHRTQWDLTGFELSEAAITIAQSNAVKNDLAVKFIQQDILQWDPPQEKVAVMVSNPPYVLPSEKKHMHANVLEHEPAIALFVPEEDPLLFYRKILLIASQCLQQKGQLYFEINPLLVDEMIALGKQYDFVFATVKKDIFGKDRFIQFSKYDD